MLLTQSHPSGLKGVPLGRPLKRIHGPDGLPPLNFDGLLEFK